MYVFIQYSESYVRGFMDMYMCLCLRERYPRSRGFLPQAWIVRLKACGAGSFVVIRRQSGTRPIDPPKISAELKATFFYHVLYFSFLSAWKIRLVDISIEMLAASRKILSRRMAYYRFHLEFDVRDYFAHFLVLLIRDHSAHLCVMDGPWKVE